MARSRKSGGKTRGPGIGRGGRPSGSKANPGKGGFHSKAQWRMFFANPKLRQYARKKAHQTKGGKIIRYRRLPARTGGPSARTLR